MAARAELKMEKSLRDSSSYIIGPVWIKLDTSSYIIGPVWIKLDRHAAYVSHYQTK